MTTFAIYVLAIILAAAGVYIVYWALASKKPATPTVLKPQTASPRLAKPSEIRIGQEVWYLQHPRSGQPRPAKAIVLHSYWKAGRGQMLLLLNRYDGRLSRPISEFV